MKTVRSSATIVAIVFVAEILQLAIAGESRGTNDDANDAFAIRLVDELGQPVAGAQVGLVARWYDMNLAKSGWEYLSGADLKAVDATSDANGSLKFAGGREKLTKFCVVARHAMRKIVATEVLDPEDKTQSFTMVMRPECHVQGLLTCKQLTTNPRIADQSISAPGAVIVVKQRGRFVAEYLSKEPSFEFYLPPGDYTLKARDPKNWTHAVTTSFSVNPEQVFLELQPIDRPLATLKLLEGELAPELSDIIAWKNSTPLKLSDLRGKVVLLEFFGHWCNPCMVAMPKIFNLHDRYSDRGLAIVGIHIDLGDDEPEPIRTVESLDKRLAEPRKRLWNDRDIPFPVALTRGRRVSYGDRIHGYARGAPAAQYGVTSYPTQVLIDREGRVVGSFYPSDENIQRLEKLLEAK
jgi:thiol-disulfide isomerase/thioredoxin